MQEYITELSRYGIAAVMLIYTVTGFAAFFSGRENGRGIYRFQCALIFLLQLICFTDLAVVSRDYQYVFFYLFVQIFLLAATVMVPIIYETANRLLLNNMCMLLGMGLCIISRISFRKALKQYIIALVALALSLTIPYLLTRIRFLKKLTWYYAAAGILLLAGVLLLGQVTNGSKIRVTLFDVITFQPSEFVKILFLFFLAGALWEKRTIHRVAVTAAVAGVHVLVLVFSRDLGSALVFFVGYVFVVFAATGNALYLLAGTVGGSAAAWVAYRFFPHVQERVLAWQEPWDYLSNESWAVTQSLFAMGSGSWFGMGLLNGRPQTIPYVEQDFIFSALCEELGVVVGVCLIFVTLNCFLLLCGMAARIRDRFYQLIVFGAGIMYCFQTFLTVGGGMNLIPLTGVTLPFLSYGGSSCMTTMLLFFIIQGIYIRMQQEGGERHADRAEG